MSTPLPYRFSIIDTSGLYVGFNYSTGIPFAYPYPKYLPTAPKSWEKTLIKWNRSLVYYGLVRTHSTPYEFVNEAAYILRYIYFTIGVNALYKLRIEKLKLDGSLEYEIFYEEELNFVNFSSNLTSVKLDIAEGGPGKYLRANENTEFEIPIQLSDCVKVLMDGIKLRNTSEWSVLNGFGTSVDFSIKNHSVQLSVVSTESPENIAGVRSVIRHTWDNFNDLFSSKDYFLKVNTTDTITITYDIQLSLAAVSGVNYATSTVFVQINQIDILGNITPWIIIQEANSTFYLNNVLSEQGTFTIPSVAGDEFYLLGRLDTGFFIEYTYLGTSLKADYFFKLVQSEIRAYRLIQILEKLVHLMSNGNFSGVSNFLSDPTIDPADNFNNIPFQTTLTCGDALRGIEIDTLGNSVDPSIRTTFSDFFKSVSAVEGMGVGVEEDSIRMEPIEYFFKTGVGDLIADLGEVVVASVEVATDYMGNSLKVGYPDQTVDNLNARDGFNVTETYRYPGQRVVKEIDMLSVYLADMYPIEFTRANLQGKTTTDSKNDNENFFISIDATPSSGVFPLYRPTPAPTGIIRPDTAFNYDLIPKANMLRNGGIVHMQNHLQDADTITFQTSDKNKNIATNNAAGLIVDTADVDVLELKPLPFLPILLKFTAQPPADLLIRLKNKPYGHFRVSIQGYQFMVFGVEAAINPHQEDVFSFTTLLGPDTNLLDLYNAINLY